MGYQFTNSKGVVHHLKSTQVTLRGGGEHTLYFFTKNPETSKGVVVDELPEGKVVRENERNGFLTLSNKIEEHDPEHVG